MENTVKLLKQAKSLLSGEPSEENAAEAYHLVALCLDLMETEQPKISFNSMLADSCCHEWYRSDNRKYVYCNKCGLSGIYDSNNYR